MLAEDALERAADSEQRTAHPQVAASVLNSTRIRPARSNAFSSSRYFVSMFAPVPHCRRSSHVQPISARRWNGSMFR